MLAGRNGELLPGRSQHSCKAARLGGSSLFLLEEVLKKSQEEKPYRGELLPIDKACKYVGLGRTTFYDCLKKGEIPYFHPLRGKILVDTADLDDWLRKSKVPAWHDAG